MEISEEKKKKSKIREQLGILLICLVLVGSGYLLMQNNGKSSGITFVSGDAQTSTKASSANTTSSKEAIAPTAGASASTTQVSEKININSASLEDLDKLPGVGPATAQKIIDYRTNNGSFKTIEEIKEVSGIGDAKYAQMKDKISI